MRRASAHVAIMLLGTVVLGACGPGIEGLGVGVSLRFDETVGDAALSSIRTLQVTASGDESFVATTVLEAPPLRSERFVYRPRSATRNLVLSLRATDAAGATVAAGTTATLLLSAGSALEAALVASAPTLPTDLGGADLPGQDLAGQDLSGHDLAGRLVTSFTLIDTSKTSAVSGVPVAGFDPIADGATIDRAVVGSMLALRANVASPAGSIRFSVDAVANFSVESVAPFAMCGDDNAGVWVPCAFEPGTHTVVATPYQAAGALGPPLSPTSLTFTLK